MTSVLKQDSPCVRYGGYTRYHLYTLFQTHFHLKTLLYFAHADEAKRANLHGYKRIIKWLPFWTEVYLMSLSGKIYWPKNLR